jgi:hypothetical protein
MKAETFFAGAAGLFEVLTTGTGLDFLMILAAGGAEGFLTFFATGAGLAAFLTGLTGLTGLDAGFFEFRVGGAGFFAFFAGAFPAALVEADFALGDFLDFVAMLVAEEKGGDM